MALADDHSQLFKEEAYELLAELESSLLELEKDPGDESLIGKIFRAMHTIKGSGAMFGFEDIASFTHEVETVYDLVRSNLLSVTKPLIDLSLEACDQIRQMLDSVEITDATLKRRKEVSDTFRSFIPGQSSDSETKAFAKTDDAENDSITRTYRIRFKPDADIFLTGTNPVMLLDELREMGSCRIVAFTDKIPEISEYDPEKCYTYWDIILTAKNDVDSIRDVFIFVEDSCQLKIDVIDSEDEVEDEYKRLGEILTEKHEIDQTALVNTLQKQQPIGKMLVESGIATEDQIQAALSEQQAVRDMRARRKESESTSSVRVPSEKLDKLVNLVGEMVIAQARLTQYSASQHLPELISITEEIERLTVELRDNTLNIRMLPIGTTFGKFRRLVRDLSNELGKDIEMKTEGAETELDKTVIERLNDPLVHLIRNCIDHGIEKPADRLAAGKPAKGSVFLSAMHSGAEVHIKIQDDGAGLDRDKILAKAIQQGLVAPGAELSKQQIFEMIMQPGFSTNTKVTSISGRGVGMDVVKKCIEALRGSVEIDSSRGKGTTITLKLPLTLAIIEGLLVAMDSRYFVLPLSSVEECVELSREDVKRAHGRNLANVRGELVPYIRLRDCFNSEETSQDIEQIVVTDQGGKKVGIVVDNVVGQHQTVIKSLGRVYRDVRGVSGATILGDGTVALILDVPQLVNDAEAQEKALSMAS